MADEANIIGASDLRAAVQAGVMSEAQAAGLSALAATRQGKRAAMPAEDEPFEFFKGFSEIFVSLGLMILLSGISLLLAWFGGFAMMIALPAISAAIAWWWATYFTLERRMNLPSMVLAVAFGTGVYLMVLTLLASGNLADRGAFVIANIAAMAAMAVWYWRFKLPFSMFILGGFGLLALYGLTASVEAIFDMRGGMANGIFDLRQSPRFSLATLGFGIAAFVAGMWFDTRDPHRLGRHAATAFWLHLLAAPALVNTVALTLMNIGGTAGMAATGAALALIAALALVIDRRSFLTAGIVYVALVISWIVRNGADDAGPGHWAFILLILGFFITALGTWWVPLRGALMRALPDFPGKSSLPPYTA
ncbi:hypothetical protein OU426_06020 [Frigidibacter sp. RF13]|uniref:hypothetical protein n=1 Tax=Frigidibacter sp. RF13 TaxID=2997340 RepID=UPI00226EBB0C|nr:hypothetical protein [Frigidibacter sp. RF13]MCY1126407.1 hypothetical protein [Frigidibacter sp. RF13]